MRAINGLLISFSVLIFSCQAEPEKGSTETKTEEKKVIVPVFNEDSAYQYIQKQVDFGYRVPGTQAHKTCANWLESELKRHKAEVIVQHDFVKTYDGKSLPMYNIIGQYNVVNKKRILLFAHWDTRHIAEKDENKPFEPIVGADDGGSGVGVLLEIARNLAKQQTEYGIDIIFFDVEDYGAPSGSMQQDTGETWCLGSQYWGKKPHVEGYRAKYGILLDMVGSKDASFPKEGTSMYYAPHIVKKVWKVAGELGYGNRFTTAVSNPTIDDHLFVNRLRNIPSIAIVNFDPSDDEKGGYGWYHHTHNDNMDIIGKETLKQVGDVVMHVIYNE